MVILKPKAAEDYIIVLVRNFVKIKSLFVSVDINVSVYYTNNNDGYIFFKILPLFAKKISMRGNLRRMACFLLIIV
jgi:hypothetical protein